MKYLAYLLLMSICSATGAEASGKWWGCFSTSTTPKGNFFLMGGLRSERESTWVPLDVQTDFRKAAEEQGLSPGVIQCTSDADPDDVERVISKALRYHVNKMGYSLTQISW